MKLAAGGCGRGRSARDGRGMMGGGHVQVPKSLGGNRHTEGTIAAGATKPDDVLSRHC